ncbi:DUF3343 domain-containing protein, partial [Verrucomicrobiota bacterium]
MKAEDRVIVIFPSTHLALSAERAARAAGIPVKMIPVPRHISPDCNMGMEVALNRQNSLKTLL